jgi:hypothetical protein
MSAKKKSSTGRLVMMKRFMLNRLVGDTGCTGTGIIAEGIIFSNGVCVITWVVGTCSVVVYDNLDDMVKVHGHGGKTIVEWID